MVSLVCRVTRTAKQADRTRAAIALFAFLATLAGLGIISPASLASPRLPVASQATLKAAAATSPSSLAPLNPAFTSYLKLHSMAPLRSGSQERSLGLIPSPIGPLPKSGGKGLRASAYPASYDLRTLGKLTPIEDQGPYNTCWAFATMGSLESCLLPLDPESFSEDNLILNSSFDSDPYNEGGNADMAAAYLARWAGPVAASRDAYGDGFTPPGLIADRHVQEALYLPSRTSSLDDEAIKSAVIAHGAVSTSMYADDGMCASAPSAAYDPASDAYSYRGSADPNHAVDIVGWDDTYSAAHFSTAPPGNGAFIVRNSWGAGWGDTGYFYVSYYDTVFGYGENVVFDDAKPATNFSAIYQYDPLGWTDSFGYANDTAWFANDFTASASDQLAAASFYAAEPGSSYTLYVGGSLSSLTADGSGSLALAGYHTVTLSSPVQLTRDQPFVVAVCLTTPGYDYPVPLETNIAGYSSGATSAPGESFTSRDGDTWTDLTTRPGCADDNVCLKAFTRTAGSSDLTPPTTTVRGADTRWHNRAVTLTFSAIDKGGSGTAYTQYSLDKGATWERATTLTLAAPSSHANDGSHTILYRSVDAAGNIEQARSCTVNIDTCRPKPVVNWAATARSGHTASLRYCISDHRPGSPTVTVTIKVKTSRGRLVRKLVASGVTVNKRLVMSFVFRRTAGRYRFFVYATDAAGNTQSSVGSNRLTVK